MGRLFILRLMERAWHHSRSATGLALGFVDLRGRWLAHTVLEQNDACLVLLVAAVRRVYGRGERTQIGSDSLVCERTVQRTTVAESAPSVCRMSRTVFPARSAP